MLTKISKASTSFLIHHQVISAEKQRIYIYGFEVIYSTIVGFCSILCLGIISHAILETLVFLFYFTMIRLFAGGYHAPTYGSCFLLTNGVYLAERVFAVILPMDLFCLWGLFLINIIYIWSTAPAPNPYRKLSDAKLKINQKRLRISLVACILLMVVYQYFNLQWIMSEAVASLSLISGLILLTKIKRRN